MHEVNYSLSRTMNLGNYESVKVQCSLTWSVPNEESLQSTYENIKAFVDQKILDEELKWKGTLH